MPYCAVLDCKNHSRNKNITHGGISYHRFPKDPCTKEKWINATGRVNWFPCKTSTICSQHFFDDDIMIKKSGNKYIKDKAEPCYNIITRKFSQVENPQEDCLGADSPCITSPRKRKLIKVIAHKESKIQSQNLKIKSLQAKNRRLGKRNANLRQVLNSIEEKFCMNNEHLRNLENTNLPVHEFIARQTRNKKSGVVTTQKYSPALRTFALTLYYYSPKAYDYVRSTFNTCLPHPQTLKKWYSKIGGESGFTKEAFEAIKIKVESRNHPIVGALIIDEMAIRRRIEWDGQRLYGYVNMGTGLEGDHLEEAKAALVFLVSAINSNFKVPVWYFLTDGVPGLQRAELVKHCIELLHNSGIKIVALTFDGCAANLAMATKLGYQIDKNNMQFKHPVTQSPVAAILDPCHMVKLLRNTLQIYQTLIDYNGDKIEWKFLQELNILQEKEKFHLTNKLTRRHINYENQRMKVKLATQLFSTSVADVLKFCRQDLKLTQFQGSEATEKFVILINNLFDIFNSKNLHQFGFKKALNENNSIQIFKYLDTAYEYISSLKIETGTFLTKSPRKTGFLGFLGCASALKLLYDQLVITKILVYLPFYKISQDHIELFFGNIRAHGGANNNPTFRQFAAAYKKMLVHVEIKNSVNGNCTALENISILNCSSAIERINKTSGPNLAEIQDQIDEGDIILNDLSEFGTQAIAYIAGYIARSLIKILKCDVCVSALTTNESTDIHKFIIAKNKGGLLFPSLDLIKICKKAESVVRSFEGTIFKKDFLIIRILKTFIGTNIFESINFHQIDEFPSSNHVTDLIKVIAEKYINVRIHHILKSNSRIISKRQFLTKYVLFQGQ